jgi:hypothetical protein
LPDGAVGSFDFGLHLSDGGERRALAGFGDDLQQRLEARGERVLDLGEPGLADGLGAIGMISRPPSTQAKTPSAKTPSRVPVCD